MFTQDEGLQFKIYLQSIINNPRTMDQQAHTRSNGFMWCDDWEIIEILKYFFNGPEGYDGDPPPNRLKRNPLWSKAEIVNKAEQLKACYETPDKIIQYFRLRRENAQGI